MKTHITFFCVLLFFIGCGSKGGDGAFESPTEPLPKNYIKSCSDGFSEVQSGDIIKKEDINTNIKIIHNTNGNKKVCVNSGIAYFSNR